MLRYLRIRASRILLFTCAAMLADISVAQRGNDNEDAPAPTIDQRTGEALNEAIEFLNMDQYEAARDVLSELRIDRLSPYERGRVEQILASIEYSLDNYPASRAHMQAAIDSGGLNAVEVSQVKYQIAQMLVAEESWAEGAAALEDWIATAAEPNSQAYYLLAVAYYQQDLFDEALPNARKSVELSETPQEAWLQMLQALLLQKEDYEAALVVLKQTVNLYPEKKVYWLQLSSVYATLEIFPEALAVLELAWHAGLLDEPADIRRLADLYMVQSSPWRAGELLSDGIDSGLLEPDARLYESLANAWVAAREYRRALPVLGQAAELSEDGNLYSRLGEVSMQLEEWSAASDAFRRALDKGDLRDEAYVHLMLGIAFYNQDNFQDARRWLQEATSSDNRERTARSYLQLIESRNG